MTPNRITFFLVWVISAVLSCDGIRSLLENDPRDLSEVDKDIARLRLIPYYRSQCNETYFLDKLDVYEEKLQAKPRLRGHPRRVRWGASKN